MGPLTTFVRVCLYLSLGEKTKRVRTCRISIIGQIGVQGWFALPICPQASSYHLGSINVASNNIIVKSGPNKESHEVLLQKKNNYLSNFISGSMVVWYLLRLSERPHTAVMGRCVVITRGCNRSVHFGRFSTTGWVIKPGEEN